MIQSEIDISIVVLSFNSKTDLERLLPSILKSEGVSFNAVASFMGPGKPVSYTGEIIVVDNGSTDNTIDWLENQCPKIHGREKMDIIRNSNNGFAKGNNLGIKVAKGKYLLILNPDTELRPDTLKTMYEFMESRPDVGMSTCKVLLPSGKLDVACRRRFPNPWNSLLRLLRISNSNYNMLDTDESVSQEIDSCMGAFMFARRLRATRYALPAFDESFFMYGEDIDLCWRVKEAGYKVWYYPETNITHYKGSSSKKVPFLALKWFHDAMWIFYRKHYAANYFFLFNWSVWLGIYCRFVALVILNAFRRNRRVSG
ncbi:MAG: glycosyltransferase family 2 protein [Candidatus Doudnabacteria bacterium]|nr:glycosyltransferase family 2 protein [Candidatus Doudnabacteria bacterium]